jgi:chromosome segregation ATPase
MADTIALNIVLNGVPQAVTNIEELELKLKQAKLELSQIAIGSDAFKKLSAEIQTAESKLKTLQKSAEGKDLEGKLGDLARLGGAIGASFGAATAAFALFGEESEDTTKALAQAQNALVIALAAREAAEGAVVIKTIANDLSTKALAISTASANSVTKTFFATLAANPYTAILTAVGLVVAALVAFTNGTEDATKAQKEFNEELKKDTAAEVSKFDALRRTIENVNLSLGTRKKALEELRGQFPAYFKDLKDEEILAGNVKIQYESLRDALIQTAEARALQNRIQKQQESLLDVEDKYIAAQKERIKLEKELRDLQNQPGGRVIGGGGITSGQVTARGGEEVILANRLTSARKEEQKLLKEKNGLQAKIKSDAGRITDIQIETDKYTGKTLEKEKDITKEKKEQVITNTRLLALEQDRAQAFEDLQAILSFESVSEPTILTDQEDRKSVV